MSECGAVCAKTTEKGDGDSSPTLPTPPTHAWDTGVQLRAGTRNGAKSASRTPWRLFPSLFIQSFPPLPYLASWSGADLVPWHRGGISAFLCWPRMTFGCAACCPQHLAGPLVSLVSSVQFIFDADRRRLASPGLGLGPSVLSCWLDHPALEEVL